jgi:hypothetical protein
VKGFSCWSCLFGWMKFQRDKPNKQNKPDRPDKPDRPEQQEHIDDQPIGRGV